MKSRTSLLAEVLAKAYFALIGSHNAHLTFAGHKSWARFDEEARAEAKDTIKAFNTLPLRLVCDWPEKVSDAIEELDHERELPNFLTALRVNYDPDGSTEERLTEAQIAAAETTEHFRVAIELKLVEQLFEPTNEALLEILGGLKALALEMGTTVRLLDEKGSHSEHWTNDGDKPDDLGYVPDPRFKAAEAALNSAAEQTLPDRLLTLAHDAVTLPYGDQSQIDAENQFFVVAVAFGWDPDSDDDFEGYALKATTGERVSWGLDKLGLQDEFHRQWGASPRELEQQQSA